MQAARRMLGGAALLLLAGCGSSTRTGGAAGGNGVAGSGGSSGAAEGSSETGGAGSGAGSSGPGAAGGGAGAGRGAAGTGIGGAGALAGDGGAGSGGRAALGGSAGMSACSGGAAGEDVANTGAPPPSGSNTVLRWYEDDVLLGEQSGSALLIFQTNDSGTYAGKAMAELPTNNVYYQPLRLSFDHASTLTAGLYSCGDGIEATPSSAADAAPVSVYVLDGSYASNTPDSWVSSDFLPYPWDSLGIHRACEKDTEGFSSSAWVRVDTTGASVSAELDLTVTSDKAEFACRTLRVHGVLRDVPVAECATSEDCNALLGHDLGIRAE
jgi:hypothetical protein